MLRLMLASLILGALACTFGGTVTERETARPTATPRPEPTPTPEAVSRFPLAEIVNDEGGATIITGELNYTYPFFTAGVAEPIVILEDEGGFVVRDRDFIIPVESQVLGQITSDFYTSPFTYSLTLPLLPKGTLRDVDQDEEENTGVMVFAPAYWTNTWGDPYLEKRDQHGGGWSSAYASTLVSDDRDNYLEIYGGKVVIYAPDDQQGFPSSFGGDGLLFTKDDPIVQVPAGWTVVDLDSDPFIFDRSQEPSIDLLEPESLALDDFSEMSYTQAFDAMLEKMRTEYAFTEYKGLDWEALGSTFQPRFEAAESSGDAAAYVLALRDFLWSIPDGHIGMDFSLLSDQFAVETAGGLGLGLAELDDGRILVNYLLEDGPADQAGIEFGAEILELNEQPIADVVEATVPWSSPFSTDHTRRLQQLRYAVRFPMGDEVEITYHNPGRSPRTATLALYPERDSFNASSFFSGVTGLELPVEFEVLEEGFGYVKITDFLDNEVLTIQLWERMIEDLNEFGIPGLIIDMRRNGGGSGYLSRQMAGYFFEEELITGNTGYYDDSIDDFYFDEGDLDRMYPPREELRYDGMIVAIVGPACSSACEFFSYYLTLEDRATVVGMYPTGGLGGSVEDFLMPEGISVRYTIGRAVDADGNIHLESIGVVPDVRVPLSEENFTALYEQGIDIELQTALEVIHKPRGAGVEPSGPPTIASQSESQNALQIQTPLLDDAALETYEEELYQPATQVYNIPMSGSRDALWVTGWCASSDQFEDNWDRIQLSFTLDGEPVPLSQFAMLDFDGSTGPCRFYYVLLTDWPVGEHVVITEMTFTSTIDDGIGTRTYAPGTRVYEYHVYVTE